MNNKPSLISALKAANIAMSEAIDQFDQNNSVQVHEAGYAGLYDDYIEIMCFRPSQNASYVYRERWEVSYMEAWAAEWLQVVGDFRTWWQNMNWSDMVKNMEEFINQHGVAEKIDQDYSEWLSRTAIS